MDQVISEKISEIKTNEWYINFGRIIDLDLDHENGHGHGHGPKPYLNSKRFAHHIHFIQLLPLHSYLPLPLPLHLPAWGKD